MHDYELSVEKLCNGLDGNPPNCGMLTLIASWLANWPIIPVAVTAATAAAFAVAPQKRFRPRSTTNEIREWNNE